MYILKCLEKQIILILFGNVLSIYFKYFGIFLNKVNYFPKFVPY